MIKETGSAVRLAIDSRILQTNIISSLKEHGLFNKLFYSHSYSDVN